MRVLLLTVLTVLAVVYHGSQTSAESRSNMLGRVLLRRALEAMANKPDEVHVNRRSAEADDSDDDSKNKDALEDIFAGSNTNEGSGSRRSDVEIQASGDQQSTSVGSVENEVSAASGSAEEQTSDAPATEVEASGQSSDEQQSQEQSQAQTQQETTADSSASSGNEGSATQETDSGSSSTSASQSVEQQQQQEAPQQTSVQSTIQVADTKKPQANEPVTVNSQDTNADKKSDIALVASAEAPLSDQESIEEAASGESEEVSSEQAQTSDEQDDGSAEAIRKGMESLTRLLKPVATGLDFQIYSGSAKPKEEDEEEDDSKSEEQKAVIKVLAKGESDKEENQDEDEQHHDEEEHHSVEKKKKEPAKVKKCETVCTIPMSYQQCAVPRCEHKVGTIKDLCYFLCEHQKPHCRQECKEV